MLLLLGGSWLAVAQAPAARGGTVQGVVLDSAATQPLREASVSLLLARDSSYVTFSLTDGSGRYSLRGLRPGRYLLLVNVLGYRALLRPVEVVAGAPALEVPPLRPRPAPQQLAEVVVTHERAPVSVRGDTIAFSARAFKTQPNAPVEQLLKKLPGLEVDRDGTLRAQGKSVDKLLVDGKPFFGGDPKMATRNLPADIIDQVQLYDQQSEAANLSGIDSGERQRTLNLVTRRDKRKGYFGTEQAGAGTAGRYQARLGLNRFNNGRQLSALAQADNVNRQGFTDDGNPAAGLAAGAGSAGSLGSNTGGLALAAPSGARNGGSRQGSGAAAGVTESVSGGLNYRDAWGRRTEVAGSYLAARATTALRQQARRQNLVSDASGQELVTDRDEPTRLRTSTQRANLRLDLALDSLTSLRLTPSLSWQTTSQLLDATQQTTSGGQLLNASRSHYAADARNLTGDGSALLLRKFKRVGRTLAAEATLHLASQRGQALNQAVNTFYPAGGGNPTTQAIDQRTEQATPTPSGLLSAAYTEPFGLRHKLDLHYAYSAAPTQARRLVADYDPASGQYDQFNAAFSNDFSSRYAAHRAGFIWQTRRLHYTYNLGLDGQLASLSLDNQTTESSLSRRYLSVLPTANFTYTGAGSRTLRLGYRSAFVAPTATQLQPVPDNSNPLSIGRGNPGLQPEYVHSLSGSYQHFAAATSRSILASASGSAVQHRVVASTALDATGVRTTQPVNSDGYWQLGGYLALGQRLPTHQLNLSSSTSASFSSSPSFINGQRNQARTLTLGQTFSANSTYNERLEFGLQASLNYQRAAYLLAPDQRTAFVSQAVSADVYYRLPGRWVLSSDAYFTNNAGLAAGYNQRQLLWNAGLAYQLFANRQGELKLYAFDLLNQNRSLTRTATDTYLEDVRSQVLPRYLLLSFTYQLRSFGK
ncbi:MAG: outer membrane beta-barrel protein [Janthinobacterium lividum]